MKKIMLALVVLFAAAVLFIGCQKKSDTGGTAAGSPAVQEKVQVALLMRNMNEQFLKDYAENVQRLAASKGVALNVQDANNAPDTQLTQLDTLLNQGYKYFVIVPCVPELSEQMNKAILDRIGNAGVAAYSNIAPTVAALKMGKNFFYASSPEFVGGRYQGQLIADYFDKYPNKAPNKTLNVLHILGQLGHPAQIYREAGLRSELATRGYTVNDIARDTANWTPDQAQQKMDAWIGAYRGKFNVVAAQNDGMALGAVESLIQNGFTKADADDGITLTVPVLGIDATGEAINSMRQNRLYATVLQDAVGQSTTAFDIVYQFATGTFKPGNSAGGIPAATTPIDEEPANDATIIQQIYLVPFVPVDKNSDYYKTH